MRRARQGPDRQARRRPGVGRAFAGGGGNADYSEEAGVDIRGRFIIDPEGTIRAMEVLAPEVGRNVSETIRQVQASQHVAKTGEVTPSGWKPGKKTLKPGPDLAGKVWKEWKPEEAFD